MPVRKIAAAWCPWGTEWGCGKRSSRSRGKKGVRESAQALKHDKIKGEGYRKKKKGLHVHAERGRKGTPKMGRTRPVNSKGRGKGGLKKTMEG